MKIKRIWGVLILAITSLLIFQALWLYSTYNIKKNDLKKVITIALIKSVKNEVEIRYNRNISDEDVIFISDPETGRNIESKKMTSVDNTEIMEAGLFQHILELSGHPFCITTLDSIFQVELQEADIPLYYLLCYKDSTGATLEQTSKLPQSKIDKAFHTESLLIVDGKRVQAIVDIPVLAAFRQMIGLLIASFLALIVIIFCVVYQTKTIFTQHKLNKLREDFIHALTHDMKTPLGTIKTVISNFMSGLLEHNSEKRERFGELAMGEVTKLLAIIERMLIIAKLEQDKDLMNRSETNIHAIINELKERFSVSAKKQASFEVSIDINERETFYLDATLINNAVSNLIENAIKYSNETVHIKISCFTEHNSLYISVKDNGFGISVKNQVKIFEKFERGAAVGRKDGASGFGVGLNLVYLAAKAHGGTVVLYSEVGEGSEFSIVLPISEQNDAE